MITHIVDTDIIIELLKGREPTVSRFRSLPPFGMSVSVISIAELYEGIHGSANQQASERDVRTVLACMAVLPVTREIAQVFGRERAALRKRGQLIDDFDLLIAATCLRHDLTLVTNNTAHFQRIPGLKLG